MQIGLGANLYNANMAKHTVHGGHYVKYRAYPEDAGQPKSYPLNIKRAHVDTTTLMHACTTPRILCNPKEGE